MMMPPPQEPARNVHVIFVAITVVVELPNPAVDVNRYGAASYPVHQHTNSFDTSQRSRRISLERNPTRFHCQVSKNRSALSKSVPRCGAGVRPVRRSRVFTGRLEIIIAPAILGAYSHSTGKVAELLAQ